VAADHHPPDVATLDAHATTAGGAFLENGVRHETHPQTVEQRTTWNSGSSKRVVACGSRANAGREPQHPSTQALSILPVQWSNKKTH
jgi:hypothetical protein